MRRIGIGELAVIIVLAGFTATIALFLRDVGVGYETMTDDQITAIGQFTKSLGMGRLPLWPLLATAAAGGTLLAASTVAEMLEMVRRPESPDAWTRVAMPLAPTLLTLVICMAQFPRLQEASVIAGGYACGAIMVFGATQGVLALRRRHQRRSATARQTEEAG